MKRTGLIAIPLLMLGTLALAHGGATGIVKERMDQMKSISNAMKTMAKMFRGEIAYDAAMVRTLAAGIGASGGKALTDLFPGNSMDPPTEARSAIWQDWENFERQAFEMKRTAIALSEGAENPGSRNDDGSPFRLFSELAGTCKSCHDDFRIKK